MDFVCIFVNMYLYLLQVLSDMTLICGFYMFICEYMYLCFLQVLSDMTLILLSVVGNLFVLNSLREKEALLAITQNLVKPYFFTFFGGLF